MKRRLTRTVEKADTSPGAHYALTMSREEMRKAIQEAMDAPLRNPICLVRWHEGPIDYNGGRGLVGVAGAPVMLPKRMGRRGRGR